MLLDSIFGAEYEFWTVTCDENAHALNGTLAASSHQEEPLVNLEATGASSRPASAAGAASHGRRLLREVRGLLALPPVLYDDEAKRFAIYSTSRSDVAGRRGIYRGAQARHLLSSTASAAHGEQHVEGELAELQLPPAPPGETRRGVSHARRATKLRSE